MANENTILTALGLDTSQFETGVNKAVGITKQLTGAAIALDSEIRKIPLLGDIYGATFGRIADGFAETKVQGREFARIMRTDVSGSLSGTHQQISEINSALKNLRESSWSRGLSDTFKFMFSAKELDENNNTPEQAKRAQQDVALSERREKLIGKLASLTQMDAAARSSAVSHSEQLSDHLKNQVSYESRLLQIKKEAEDIRGPDQAGKRKEYIREQHDLAKSNYRDQEEAIKRNYASQNLSFGLSVDIAKLQSSGNDTAKSIADRRVEAALQEYKLAKGTTKERETAAGAALLIAVENVKVATRATALEQAQLDLSTKESEIKKKGYNETVRMAEARLDLARKEEAIAVGPRASQAASAKTVTAEVEVRIAKESRAQYEAGLVIATSIAKARGYAAQVEAKSLADQQKAAEASLGRMRKEGGMEDEIKKKELEILQIGKQRYNQSMEVAIAERNALNQTELMEAQVNGQTRAANQAKIRLTYETQIAQAMKDGTEQQVNQLKAQEKLAVLAEAIRLYELGGKGRAKERQAERDHARNVRVVNARLRTHEEAGGFIAPRLVGLNAGGFHPGNPAKAEVGNAPFNAKEFADRLFSILSK